MLDRRRFLGLASASALARPAAAQSSLTQNWPSRSVRLICPIAAGGSIDAVARIVAARLSEIWRQQVVVENRTGGGVNIAAEAVARSEPDGYTIFATPSSLAMAGLLFPSLTYDPIADFAPVSLIGTYPNIMVVPNSSPAHTVKEFIAYAKANRGKITYASGGHGSSLHLAGELFKRMTGIEMTHIPYRGATPAFNDLIPGRVDVMFNLISSSLPLARSGQIRALGVATLQRVAVMPDLPTISEAGVPDFDMSSWIALFLPAKTPPQIVSKLHADTVALLTDPATKRKLEDMGVVVAGSTPAELAATFKADIEKWGPIIKENGISLRD
ncbi:MAG TPA: tripartite tricarboxylate transporter substrate binding protein [Xanthobacteraceae bacterium]|nr:tripartite tricarboxylate transporter substrate binding protein [Xanthobacteraceae bacterium]